MKKLLIFLSLLTSAAAFAQPFSVDWYKIADGGGTSTGGVFSVSGTIGQSDAGKMSGGSFTVDGGFWGIIAVVQTPGAPLLTLTRTGTNVVISWPSPSTGFVLQQNSVINNTNWTNFGGVVGDDGTLKRVTNAPPAGNLFFRLKK